MTTACSEFSTSAVPGKRLTFTPSASWWWPAWRSRINCGSRRIIARYRLANEYLRTVINSVSDGIVAIDSNGFIKEINSEAANILATDSLFARGKDIQDFVGKQPLFKKVIADGKPVTDMEATMETRRGYTQCHISAKPISRADGQVVGVVATLKEMKKLQRVVNQITGAEARFNFANILGESSSMQRAIHLAQVAARNMHTVLILGESGTGKELFAQAIHNASITGQPFIALNCAAIPETLIESELFGYEGGSFTGANRNGRPGKFELANDGTIFLDEIGEMPLNIQAVLLRVLQERSVVRIGGHRPTPINVRVIAATSKDLAIEVPKGNFRQGSFLPPERVRNSHPALAREKRRHCRVGGPSGRYIFRALWQGRHRGFASRAETLVHLSLARQCSSIGKCCGTRHQSGGWRDYRGTTPARFSIRRTAPAH